MIQQSSRRTTLRRAEPLGDDPDDDGDARADDDRPGPIRQPARASAATATRGIDHDPANRGELRATGHRHRERDVVGPRLGRGPDETTVLQSKAGRQSRGVDVELGVRRGDGEEVHGAVAVADGAAGKQVERIAWVGADLALDVVGQPVTVGVDDPDVRERHPDPRAHALVLLVVQGVRRNRDRVDDLGLRARSKLQRRDPL